MKANLKTETLNLITILSVRAGAELSFLVVRARDSGDVFAQDAQAVAVGKQRRRGARHIQIQSAPHRHLRDFPTFV